MALSKEIDNDLYDRQIRVYGKESVMKMCSRTVLIIGLEGGLGTETAKNLVLGGVNIVLCDNDKVKLSDCETGYYYNSDSIGMCRSNALVSSLQELNPYVIVQSIKDYKKTEYDVVIIINQSIQKVNEINKYSRENNSKTVVLYSKGVSGVVFVDSGPSHIITDTSSEIIEPVQISKITPDGKVNCDVNSTHDFQSGNYILLDNLEGTNIEQFNKEWEIDVINNRTFQLKNFDIDNYTFINGTATLIKKPIQISHQDWEQQIKEPTLSFSFDMEHSKQLVYTFIKMFDNNIVDSMPDIGTESNKEFMKEKHIPLPEFARIFKFEIIPVVSLMGSIASSEAIKLITNKYTPVNQWFTWSDPELLQKCENKNECKTSYGNIWGNDFENKLINSKWFIVGSGAIGCEHLKNLAFMNVANGEYGNGEIIITDPDSIEKSNLNRQFLFRSNHIGKLKSEMAAESIIKMKPGIKIEPLTQKVGSESMDFIDNIMGSDSNITGVLNALDNITARRFMDDMCFKYGLPLFESGTMGTKGSTQPVLPFITETYSNSSDPEEEKSFPICTIKSFPNEISHTIHYAMDLFELFKRAPSTMNKWITNPKSIEKLNQIERTIAMNDINEFTIKHPTQKTGIKGCVEWAIDKFTEDYHNSIVQLLHTFPPDHETAPGVKFWSAGKKCPKPIKFDSHNTEHIKYINATTHILARISGIDDNFTNNDLKKIISEYKSKEFVPKKIKIAADDSELDKDKKQEQEQEQIIGNPSEFTPSFVPQEFDKDDNSNWHIDWITSASNLRAINYNIPIADRHKTKGIAGRIIPAIATTTSAVSGLILIEMLKYIMGFDNINQYRSTFINLAEPIIVYTEPIQAPNIEISGVKFNSWTKFEYTIDSTVGEFKKYYDKEFKTDINMIVIGSSIVYADFIGSDSLDIKLSDSIKEALEISHVPPNVSVNLASNNDDIELPTININLV